MRIKTVKTALGIAILGVMAVFGLTLSAYAISGEMAGTALLFTYYDTRPEALGGLGLNDNYMVVTNNSSNWVQAHVRVRTGKKSVELLDFDILMSPKDNFAFDLFFIDGKMTFASCDTKTLLDSNFALNYARDGTNLDCFLIDSASFPEMLSLIKTCEGVDDAEALLQTMKGYVEVIGEGIIVPCGKDLCQAVDASCTVSIPNKTLLNSSAAASLSDLCPAAVYGMNAYPARLSTGELSGRVYYATLTGPDTPAQGVVIKLASLNAEVLDNLLPDGGALPGSPILHYEEYGAESGSTHCSVPIESAATPCYAYVAAATAVPANGADDLNYCFYTDTIGSTGVINKFGAAGTFGPTLVDLQVRRDGTIPTTAGALNVLTTNMALGNATIDAISAPVYPKVFADTHYFAVPLPPYTHDMNSGFSFIFPLQHFIGEKERISLLAIYDNDERTTTIGKFISPGLPTGVDAEEANLFFLTSSVPFVEGWLRFAPTATNGTSSCTAPPTGCAVIGLSPTTGGPVATPGETYVPAYTAAIFVNGANELTATHFQYSASFTQTP